MTDFSPEARALLRGAREELEPSADERTRVERALAARLGVAVGAIAATSTAGSASAATSALVAGAKWVGAILIVGAIGAGGVSVYRSGPAGATSAPRAPVVAMAEPAQVLPGAPSSAPSAPSAQPVPERRDPATVASVPPRPGGLSSPRAMSQRRDPPLAPAPVQNVAEETRLLRRADEALRSGDAAGALALLDEHARRFPRGILAEERSAERVSTLCKLDRVADARAEAVRFLRTSPDSPLAESVLESCGGAQPAVR